MTQPTDKKQKLKKVLNAITTAIFAVVFVFLVVVVIMTNTQRKSGKDVQIFGHYMFVVVTDSMTPTIEPKEAIWCKVPEEGDIVEGAVITFVAPSGTLKGHNETHRISRIIYDENGNIDKIYTRGDKEGLSEDPWTIQEEDVKAVYVRTLPLISAIMGFVLEQPFLAYLLFIAIPLLAVSIMFIVGFVTDRLKKQKEEEKTNLDDLSDEEKKKLLEDYIASSNSNNFSSENDHENCVDEGVEDGIDDEFDFEILEDMEDEDMGEF